MSSLQFHVSYLCSLQFAGGNSHKTKITFAFLIVDAHCSMGLSMWTMSMTWRSYLQQGLFHRSSKFSDPKSTHVLFSSLFPLSVLCLLFLLCVPWFSLFGFLLPSCLHARQYHGCLPVTSRFWHRNWVHGLAFDIGLHCSWELTKAAGKFVISRTYCVWWWLNMWGTVAIVHIAFLFYSALFSLSFFLFLLQFAAWISFDLVWKFQ